MQAKVLNLFGPINPMGYGVHFTNWAGHLIPMLQELGVRIALVPKQVNMQEGKLTRVQAMVMGAASKATEYEPDEPSICLWHASHTAEFCGKPRFFYTVWEGTRLRPREEYGLSKVDRIIVPTQWHKQILNETYPHLPKSYVIPEGIDPLVFFWGETGRITEWTNPEVPQDAVTYVSVGKMEKRKGMEVMVEALKEAANLRRDRSIRLLAHWFNQFIPEFPMALVVWMERYGFRQVNGPDERIWCFRNDRYPNLYIDCLRRPLASHSDLVTLYRTGHWGLFPHYAEGWGLPLIESMACGLPPITQYYSGPTEYLKPGSFLQIEGVQVMAKDNLFFTDGQAGLWSQTSTDSLIAALTLSLEATQEERVGLGKAAHAAAHEFPWSRAAMETMNMLQTEGLLNE